MKKSLLLLIAAVGLLFSCSNIFDKGGDEDRNSADGGTYLVIGSASVARTLDTDSADEYLNKLTGFVLKGTRKNAAGEFEDEITLAPAADSGKESFEKIDDLVGKQIPIQTGVWSLTLTANLDGAEFSDTVTDFEIKAGENNKISFNLEAQSNGGISITVQFYDTTESLTSVTATLTSVDGTTSIGEPQTFAKSDFKDAGKDEDEKQLYSVTYTSGAEGLASGTYHLVFDFYAEGTTAPLNSPDYLVRVSDGITTKATQTILLNETYTITYEMNGGVLPEGKTLPGKYSRKSETISLPVMKDNENTDLTTIEKIDWVFDGWYTDSAFTAGNEISAIATGTTGNLVLYAKWHKRLEDSSFSVSINVDQSDIEVTNNAVAAAEDKNPEITFTAPEMVGEKTIESFSWSLDGESCGSARSLTIDTSDWVSSVYTVTLIAKDSEGTYYSYIAQIDWTRLYNIEFNTENNPEITTIPSQYVREGDGITFAATPTYGWYTDADFTTPFNDDDKPTSNLTLYGCWNLNGNIHVSENGIDPTDTANSDGRGTAGRPFATIESALRLVKDSEQDYTIFVDGELSGGQTLGSSLDGMAKSITLSGRNGNETDKLNGGFNSETQGTTLTIGTSVPVTIKDLTITGGHGGDAIYPAGTEVKGGGIQAKDYTDVTLGEGTLITGNYSGIGGGVYAAIEEYSEQVTKTIKLTIEEGAVISGNTASYGGGGVYASTYNGGKVDVIMNGGVIGGSGANDGNTTSGVAMELNTGGGGVVVYGPNASFTMNGGVIEGNSSPDYGGGVGINNSATFVMKDGEIKNNKATSGSGGGVSAYKYATFKMTGGKLIGNSATQYGAGVYVAPHASNPSVFQMGGSAVVDSGNTVSLCGTKLQILGELTGETPVATIDSSTCNDTMPVLEVSTVTEEGMTSTTLAKEYGKFAVTQSGTGIYVISSEGKLIGCNATASTAPAYITSMAESGTVTVAGSMTTSDLQAIASAMANKYTSDSELRIKLDLSYTTGLTELKAEFNNIYNIEELVLPEGIVKISSIGQTDNLKTLNIPSTVTEIGELAFFRCPANLTLSEGNKNFKIENDALYTADLTKLVSYANKFLETDSDGNAVAPSGTCEVLASTEEILPGAFSQANNLKTLTFATPSSLTKIDYCAFDYCGALEDVVLPDSVTELGNGVFQYAHVTSMVLSENITEIPSETFSNNYFTSIVIPDGVKSIGAEAFLACELLKEITLPVSLESIAENAFKYCEKLTTVNYKGTEAQKEAMTISDTNIPATWNFVTWSNPPVTLTAGDVTKGAFASLDSALAAIEALDSSSTAYTIYIDGEITGAQTIGSSLYGKARSITLEGSDNSTSILNGNKVGTTLTIGSVDKYSSTPSVTLKNLKITGGSTEGNGGGIIAGKGANLTISEGTLITGNTAALNGGGVYLCEQVYFTMTGGSITNNSAENGAGIYTNSTMGGTLNGNLFNGGGVMSGGTISANTASGNGGGIYLSGTDGFAMTGGTITGNEAEGKGKGVYVASMGSSTGEHSLMMGGSAFIASNNDVYLSVNTDNTYQPNKAIYLLSSLTSETTPVATITPAEYSTSAYVLARPQTSSSSTSVSAECSKFAVTSQTGETTVWGIASGGQLKILEACAKINDTVCYRVADIINRIKSAESATTVVLYNNLSADEIGKAGTAGTIINAIKSNASSSATFEVSVDATGGKIALAADCSYMFESCAKITSLDMSGFDASGATDMSDMFYGCSELTTLNLNNFDTSNVTDMKFMFANCKKLVTLTLSNSFNTSKVTSMYSMFQSCSSLTAVDLSSFNTAAVTGSASGFQNMFSYCSSLTTLDVSTFTIVGDANIGYMFQNCSSLVTIYAASDADWNADDRTSTNMFDGCTKLVGGTSYSSYYVNAVRANTTENGYFTKKD